MQSHTKFAAAAILLASIVALAEGACPAEYTSKAGWDACYKEITGTFNKKSHGETAAACKKDNPMAYLPVFRHEKDWKHFLEYLKDIKWTFHDRKSIWLAGSDQKKEGLWTIKGSDGLSCKMNNPKVCATNCGTWTKWGADNPTGHSAAGVEHFNSLHTDVMNDVSENYAAYEFKPICQIASFDVCSPCESKANRPGGCHGEASECVNRPTNGICGYNKAEKTDMQCPYPMSIHKGKCTCIPSASTDASEGKTCCSDGSKPTKGKCPKPTGCIVDANCLITFDPKAPSKGGKCVEGKCQDAPSDGICPAGYTSKGGWDACYKEIKGTFNKKSHGETAAACKADNPKAHLPVFRHEKDWKNFFKYLKSIQWTFPDRKSIWLAGSDQKKEGVWTIKSSTGLSCKMHNPKVCATNCGTWTKWGGGNPTGHSASGVEHFNSLHTGVMNDVSENYAAYEFKPICQIARFDVCSPCESKDNFPDGCYGESNQCVNAPKYEMCGLYKVAKTDAECQFPMSVFKGKCTCIPSASFDASEGKTCCSDGSEPVEKKCPKPTGCLVDANCLVTFDPEQPSMGGKCVKGKCQP